MKNGSYSVWSGRSPLVGDVCERANVTQVLAQGPSFFTVSRAREIGRLWAP